MTQAPTSTNVKVILSICKGRAYNHEGRQRKSLCLEKTGTYAVVMDICDNPVNITTTTTVKNKAPT